MTMPEITYAVSQLSRFISNPGQVHFDAAIRVLVYLSGLTDHSLTYTPNLDLSFDTFVDSSWETKFSCSGAFFMFYGCPFHWFSKMQRSVSLSSAEAEFFGAMLATKDVLFIRELLADLGFFKAGRSHIMSDSQSAVNMSFDPVAFHNTKHILRAAEFLRDLVEREFISLSHLPGAIMIADILTKAVARPLFIDLLRRMREYARHAHQRMLVSSSTAVVSSGGAATT